MNAKGTLRIFGVLFALCSGLGLGLGLSVWSGAARWNPNISLPAHAAQVAPRITSTPILPDFAAQLAWDDRWTCPYPVLDLVGYPVQSAPCFEHVSFNMHLINNNGGSRDFSTGTTHGYALIVCQVGRDVPFDWLQAMPFTLTVNASVPDINGSNNTTILNSPPPQPTACVTLTAVATPTQIPPPPNTPTCTPTRTRPINLTGGMTWNSTPCPASVLKLRTTLTGEDAVCHGAYPSHMRLSNNGGEHMDFDVSGLSGITAYDELDCPVGSCMPASWLDSFPLTLTVDIFNQVNEQWEGGEGDNNSQLSSQPCSTTATPTYTPTRTPTITDTPCPMDFTDVNPGDYFYQAVRYLYCHGAISGYGDGTFRPYNNVNRGQTCKIVVIAFDVPINTQGGPHFTDVPEDHPFYQWIESAYNRGIITGYDDGTFRPYNNLTRGQLTKIICRVLNWPPMDPPVPSFSDVPRDNPFYGYLEAAYCGGIITGYGDGTFRPYNNVTRAQTCLIVYRALTGGYSCGTPTPIATATVRY